MDCYQYQSPEAKSSYTPFVLLHQKGQFVLVGQLVPACRGGDQERVRLPEHMYVHNLSTGRADRQTDRQTNRYTPVDLCYQMGQFFLLIHVVPSREMEAITCT